MKLEDLTINITFTDKVNLELVAKFEDMTEMQHFLDNLKEVMKKEITTSKLDEISKTKGANS